MRISDWSSDVCSSDLSVLVDRSTKSITFIASSEGGVEIEKTAVDNPDAIKTLNVNYVQGLQPYQCRDMGFGLGLTSKQVNQLTKIMLGLYTLSNAKSSEEHTSELQSLMRISYADFCSQ